MPISLDDVVLLPVEAAEAAIQAHLPPGLILEIQPDEAFLRARFLMSDGTVIWTGYGSDRRILLFDAYGWLLQQRGVRPGHPAWVRRSENVVIPPRYGSKAHQSHTPIPDPEDLNPSEILSVYGISSRKKDVDR